MNVSLHPLNSSMLSQSYAVTDVLYGIDLTHVFRGENNGGTFTIFYILAFLACLQIPIIHIANPKKCLERSVFHTIFMIYIWVSSMLLILTDEPVLSTLMKHWPMQYENQLEMLDQLKCSHVCEYASYLYYLGLYGLQMITLVRTVFKLQLFYQNYKSALINSAPRCCEAMCQRVAKDQMRSWQDMNKEELDLWCSNVGNNNNRNIRAVDVPKSEITQKQMILSVLGVFFVSAVLGSTRVDHNGAGFIIDGKNHTTAGCKLLLSSPDDQRDVDRLGIDLLYISISMTGQVTLALVVSAICFIRGRSVGTEWNFSDVFVFSWALIQLFFNFPSLIFLHNQFMDPYYITTEDGQNYFVFGKTLNYIGLALGFETYVVLLLMGGRPYDE